MRKYDRAEEQKIEREWKKYEDERCLPIRYENGVVRDDVKELARKIFCFLYREGNEKTCGTLEDMYNVTYDAHFYYNYYDEDTNKDVSAKVWNRLFTIKWDGFEISIISNSGRIWKNVFDFLLKRTIHLSDYDAEISYCGIFVKGHYDKLQILAKLFEYFKDKHDEIENEYKQKLASIVPEPIAVN